MIVVILPLSTGAVDAQEGFVVIILIPVERGDPGESPLRVATEQTGGGGHNLAKRRGHLGLKEG